MPRQGRRLGTPEVWNVSFYQDLICGSCQERLRPQPPSAACHEQFRHQSWRPWPNFWQPADLEPFRLPRALLTTAIPWATARSTSRTTFRGSCLEPFRPQPSVFTGVQTAVCQASKPPKPSAASFAPRGRLWPQHHLVFTTVQDCRLPGVKTTKTCRGVVCSRGRLWPQPYLGPLPQARAGKRSAAAAWNPSGHSHLFLPVSKTAVCQASKPPKPSAASFAPPGDSGHSHTLGHCHLYLPVSRLPFARRQNHQNPPRRRLLPAGDSGHSAIWFLPVSKTAVCQASKPPKPAAASFAPAGDSGHSHTLGHCHKHEPENVPRQLPGTLPATAIFFYLREEGKRARGQEREDVKMRRYEDVKIRSCEDEKMWRWEDVQIERWKDVQMKRWEDVKMRRCENKKMGRCEDKRIKRCEDKKMKRCEDEKMWRWEGV